MSSIYPAHTHLFVEVARKWRMQVLNRIFSLRRCDFMSYLQAKRWFTLSSAVYLMKHLSATLRWFTSAHLQPISTWPCFESSATSSPMHDTLIVLQVATAAVTFAFPSLTLTFVLFFLMVQSWLRDVCELVRLWKRLSRGPPGTIKVCHVNYMYACGIKCSKWEISLNASY